MLGKIMHENFVCVMRTEDVQEIPSTLCDMISSCVHLNVNEFSAWMCSTYIPPNPLPSTPSSPTTHKPKANFIILFKLKKNVD